MQILSNFEPLANCGLVIGLQTLNDILTGTDRIVNTPLPIAYSITISQISWVYIIILPFMLLLKFKWLAIPATIVVAYVILGLLTIGTELENPSNLTTCHSTHYT
jgi:putative membrane protein